MHPHSQPINRDEYCDLLEGIDIVAMPYQLDHYSISPSGVLLDAIAFRKPVIATPIPLVKHLFDRFGEFGILAEIRQWPEKLIRDLGCCESSRYATWRENVLHVAEARSLSNLSNNYRDAVSQFVSS